MTVGFSTILNDSAPWMTFLSDSISANAAFRYVRVTNNIVVLPQQFTFSKPAMTEGFAVQGNNALRSVVETS